MIVAQKAQDCLLLNTISYFAWKPQNYVSLEGQRKVAEDFKS